MNPDQSEDNQSSGEENQTQDVNQKEDQDSANQQQNTRRSRRTIKTNHYYTQKINELTSNEDRNKKKKNQKQKNNQTEESSKSGNQQSDDEQNKNGDESDQESNLSFGQIIEKKKEKYIKTCRVPGYMPSNYLPIGYRKSNKKKDYIVQYAAFLVQKQEEIQNVNEFESKEQINNDQISESNNLLSDNSLGNNEILEHNTLQIQEEGTSLSSRNHDKEINYKTYANLGKRTKNQTQKKQLQVQKQNVVKNQKKSEGSNKILLTIPNNNTGSQQIQTKGNNSNKIVLDFKEGKSKNNIQSRNNNLPPTITSELLSKDAPIISEGSSIVTEETEQDKKNRLKDKKQKPVNNIQIEASSKDKTKGMKPQKKQQHKHQETSEFVTINLEKEKPVGERETLGKKKENKQNTKNLKKNTQQVQENEENEQNTGSNSNISQGQNQSQVQNVLQEPEQNNEIKKLQKQKSQTKSPQPEKEMDLYDIMMKQFQDIAGDEAQDLNKSNKKQNNSKAQLEEEPQIQKKVQTENISNSQQQNLQLNNQNNQQQFQNQINNNQNNLNIPQQPLSFLNQSKNLQQNQQIQNQKFNSNSNLPQNNFQNNNFNNNINNGILNVGSFTNLNSINQQSGSSHTMLPQISPSQSQQLKPVSQQGQLSNSQQLPVQFQPQMMILNPQMLQNMQGHRIQNVGFPVMNMQNGGNNVMLLFSTAQDQPIQMDKINNIPNGMLKIDEVNQNSPIFQSNINKLQQQQNSQANNGDQNVQKPQNNQEAFNNLKKDFNSVKKDFKPSILSN